MCQVAGLALLVCHVFLSKVSLFLFFPLPLIVLGAVYYKARLAGLLLFFQFLIYQNWIISILSDGMDYNTYMTLLGSSFAALVVLSAISLTRLMSSKGRYPHDRLLLAVKLALFVACVYALIGLAKVGGSSAAVYFREATSLVLAVPIGLDVGRIWGYRTVAIGFLASAALSVAVSAVEIATPAAYYDAINAPTYVNMKYSRMESSMKDPLDAGLVYSGQQLKDNQEAVFFNVTGSESNGRSFRFMGTTLNPIAYGYLLADIALVSLSIGTIAWLWIVVPMMAMIGVKGAALLSICSLALWLIWRLNHSRRFLFISGVILIAGYVAFGLSFGLQRGDWHVIGFLGGLKGLLSDPIGRGLGVGGNFSTLGMQRVNWEQFQHTGATFALESAIGVLVYQMGIASAAIFAIIVYLIKDAPFGLKKAAWRDIIFLGLATVTVNGIFQEEAFTSYSCGMFTLFASIITANGYRESALFAGKAAAARLPRVRSLVPTRVGT